MARKIGEMIESTKYRKRPNDYLTRIFWDADNAGFLDSYENFLEVEKKVKEEFSHLSLKSYKKGRISFLKSCLGVMGEKADRNIKMLIDHIEKNY
jgi:predicted metal-dependent HD superfamily phosphohydrolase